VHSFVELLAAEEPIIVNVASFVLGYARWEQAIPYLKHIATRNFEPTQAAAIWALGETRNKDALDALIALSTHGKHLDVVLPALAAIGDPTALEVIVPILSSQIPSTRLAAATAIWSIVAQARDPKSKASSKDLAYLVPPLQAATKDDFAPVAIFALLALANLGERIEEDVVRNVLELGEKTKFTSSEAYFLTRDRPLRGKPS
jgi:HEAT repeat protein